MAYSLVQHTGGTFSAASGSTFAGTFSSNITAGNLIILSANVFGVDFVSVGDNNTNTYTRVGTLLNSDTDRTGLWYVGSANAGSTIVSGTVNGTHARTIAIYEFSGNAKTSTLDQSGSLVGTSTAVIPGTLTPNQNNSLIFSLGVESTGTHGTVGSASGYTIGDVFDSDAFAEPLFTQYLIQSTAGATSGSFTIAPSGIWSGIQAVFKPAAAGVAPTVPYRTLLGVGI